MTKETKTEVKRMILNGLIVVCVIASICFVIGYKNNRLKNASHTYDDGVTQIDLNRIKLEDSGVEVEFADVLIVERRETRKLIVAEHKSTAKTKLSKKTIEWLDADFNIKTQEVVYSGMGYFVVDLDQLNKKDVVQDKSNKTVTIKIPHARLDDIVIDPNEVKIENVKEALLARGNIKLSVQEYNQIERHLRKQMREAFETVENGQDADKKALSAVRKIYEPLITAMDSSYTLKVEFK